MPAELRRPYRRNAAQTKHRSHRDMYFQIQALHKPIHQRPAPRQKLPLPLTLGLMTDGGKIAIELPGGEERRFLESCDEVILRARCQREGHVSIGFGECRGVVNG